MITVAITRQPGIDFAQGITTSQIGKPDYQLMSKQHEAYIAVLRQLGIDVIMLESLVGYPDAYFVEDVAVVFPEAAVITRPGALARRGEEEAMAPVLARYRKIFRIQEPGTMDGGDVLLIGMRFLVGISDRTNQEGAAQFGQIVEPYGYSCTPIPVTAGLHFKSSVSHVGKNSLLVTQAFAGKQELTTYNQILVEPGEEYASNTLFLNNHLIMPAGFPATRRSLQRLGLEIIEVNVSEAQKMDGGLTCMSLRL